MSFIIGLLSGLLVGAAGAVMYSVQTGRDLRQEFEQARREIDQRDFDALGRHLEERFKELQSSLEERFAAGRAEPASEPTSEHGTASPGEGGAGTSEWENRGPGEAG